MDYGIAYRDGDNLEVKLIDMDYGIAYRDGDRIYFNKCLLEDERVFMDIFRHELKHLDGPYSLFDLMLDLQPVSLRTQLFFFYHPSTWTALSPIIWLDGRWRYDPATVFMCGLSLIIGGVLCYLML